MRARVPISDGQLDAEGRWKGHDSVLAPEDRPDPPAWAVEVLVRAWESEAFESLDREVSSEEWAAEALPIARGLLGPSVRGEALARALWAARTGVLPGRRVTGSRGGLLLALTEVALRTDPPEMTEVAERLFPEPEGSEG